MRTFNVVIGAKAYFSDKTKDLVKPTLFLDIVTLNDNYHKIGKPFPNNEKAKLLIVRNDSYIGITESANDRVGNLILELTSDDAVVWLHNPSSNLLFFLNSLKDSKEIKLDIDRQKYDITRDKNNYVNGMRAIHQIVIGQDNAIIETSKSLRYLTSVQRKKPYVIMLYGNSSIGKTELVKAIAKNFFDNKFLEKHLSMFKSNVNSDYLFGDKPNRRSIGFDLLERGSNLIFLDEFDKCAEFFYSVFYTLFDNTVFKDAVYEVDISGALIILTSNYSNEDEMKEHLGLPIYYRIDKFIHFEDFSQETIYKIVCKELDDKYEEYKDYFTKEEVYSIVSKRILSQGENARTIKNKIQAVLEELLFKAMLESKEDVASALEEN